MSNRAIKVMLAGLPAQVANQIAGDVQAGVTAAGTTQATAHAVYGDNVQITTCASGAGVILSGPSSGTSGVAAFGPGDDIFIYNGGANACLVYPPTGGYINALAQNAGYSLAAGSSTLLRCMGAITSGNLQFYTK